ncbi:MAG TPA: pentapeptide repeat-containing protein [Gaiellales bacterium]|nr:pentapeptide repeat-containing protein [Gaiellales bacterium]
MPSPTTPSEPRLPASLELLSADDPGLRGIRELAGVELYGAGWAGLDASGVRAAEARLLGCDLSGALLADPQLTDVVLDEPNLANAVIRGGSLTRVLVSGGRLTGAQWAETHIHDTVWRNAAADLSAFRMSELVRVTFDSCNLREADFTAARCSWVRFHDCDLTGAVFSHARFANSELRRCRLEAVEGVAGLAGASIEFDAALAIAPQLADALGIHLLDD